MNILYYGFSGSGPNIFGGIFLFILATISAIIGVIMTITKSNCTPFVWGCGITVIFVLFGLAECLDTRIPIIKTTMNGEVSWQEIYNKYEIESQEGEIYTFKVKDITNEEWDVFLREYYNE